MIATDLAQALDPALFMREAGAPPDPWQCDFVRSTAPRHILLCCRQAGKSTVTAALATHTALYRPDSLILVLAPSQNQAGELYRKILSFARQAQIDPEAESARRIELPNRSRIVALSGNPVTMRGYSAPGLVVVDEAAFADDELFHAITPMLAGGGRLVLLSTPNGRQGYFYGAWERGGADWERTRVTGYDTPRLPAAFIELERRSKPDRDFRREYLCEFVDTNEQLFSSELIDRAFRSPEQPAPFLDTPFTWGHSRSLIEVA